MKRFKGKVGEEYDLFKLVCSHFEKLENKIGEIIKNTYKNSKQNKIRVLEIGCGPGHTTLIILDSDKRTKITAVDNEEIMIKQADQILKKFINSGRVKLVEKDALKFLKKQSSDLFDVFASGFTLHNFAKDFRKKVLKEIHRVLKPNGLFINADKYALDDEKKHKETLNWQLNQFKEKYSKINRPDLIEEWTKHYLEDNKPNVIMKEGKSIEDMKDLGFKEIKTAFRAQMDAVIIAKK